MVLAGLYPWQAMNLALKWCFAGDTASAPLLWLSAQRQSLPAALGHGAMGSVPLQRDELAAAHRHSETSCAQPWFWLPGGAVGVRRGGDSKHGAAAAFPAGSLQHGPSRAQFIALLWRADGFHTPALGVFMDSLPVKLARGRIPQAPEVLPCTGRPCSPSSLPARLLHRAAARAHPLMG